MNLEPPSSGSDEVAEIQVPRRVIAAGAEVSAEEGGGGGEHPVRQRLLERAAQARGDGGADQTARGFDSILGSFTEELDRVAARGIAPSAPALGGGRKPVSPNVVAVFATLLGLALFAATFSVLIHLDPRDETTVVVTPPTASGKAPEPLQAPPPPIARKPERPRLPGPWRIADSTDAKLKKVEATVGRVPFLKVLEDAGIPRAQTFRILKVMKDLRDLDHCGRSDQIAALIERGSGRVAAFEYVVNREEVYQAREGTDGLLKASRLDLKVERARVQGAFRLDHASFSANLEAGGFEPSLAAVLDDALEGHMTVADFRPGDRLRVVAQEISVLGEFSRYAGIEALEYVPAKEGERPLRIYYFKGPKSHGYFDPEGRSVSEGGWRRPIKGAPITSRFNPKRMHPVLHKIMPHQGTDFGAPMGTPVGASGPGTVHSLGYEGPSGNLVVLQHAGGLQTGYAHLSRFEPGLKVGDHVAQLQVIGYVGSTGRSTGPHLHFSLKKNGVFLDAETLRFDSLRLLPESERGAFLDERQKLDALIDGVALPPPAVIAAAPAAAPSSEPAGEELADEHLAEEAAQGAAAPGAAPPAAPATTPPAAAAPAAAASPAPGKGPSIYLSDQDLLKSQPATDDGEVER